MKTPRIGDAANLLLGLRPGWPASPENLPYFTPSGQPLTTFDLDIQPNGDAGWDSPVLSLHDNVEDLINEVFDYRIHRFHQDNTGFHIPASTLLLSQPRRIEVLSEISRLLGIELRPEQADSYLLVKMRRHAGACTYEPERRVIGQRIKIEDYWTQEGRNAMGRLRVALQSYDVMSRDAIVTAKQAKRYLDYFYDFGTHFLSRVEFGDLIFQVFACKPEHYLQLKLVLNRESNGLPVVGPAVAGCRVFTTSNWVSARGRIVSLGNDGALQELLRAGKCHDQEFAAGDSILKPIADGPTALNEFLQPLSQNVPIAMEFVPQSSYMGSLRPFACQRLLKGALLHRFGKGIKLPLGPNIAFNQLEHMPGNPGFPAIGAPRTRITQAKLYAADCQFVNADQMEEFSIHSLLFEFASGASIPLPGKRIRICSYQTLVPGEAGAVPTIVLDDDAFEGYEFITAQMQGALFVTDRAGARRETIVDGFRFATETTEEDGDHGRVVVRGDLQTPTGEILQSMTDDAQSFVNVVESLLSVPTDQQPDGTHAVRGYLEWLTVVLKNNRHHQAFRVQLLYLSRVAGSLAPDNSIPVSRVEFSLTSLAEIVRIAARLETTVRESRMVIRGRRSRDIHADAVETDAICTASQPFQELAIALERAGDQIENVLLAIRDPMEESLELHCRRVEECRERLNRTGRNVLEVVNETGAQWGDDPLSVQARAVLDAVSDIARAEPITKCPVRPLRGEDPVAGFWRLALKINQASIAAIAMEGPKNASSAQSLDHVEQWLDKLCGTVELPSQEEWRELPQLVGQALSLLSPDWENAKLESALQSLVGDASELLLERSTRARLWIQKNGTLWQVEFSTGADSGAIVPASPNRVFHQECRLTKLLSYSWNLQNALLESSGLERTGLFQAWDLPSLLHLLIARQQHLNQHEGQ